MKRLKFSDIHIKPIINKDKNITWRINDEKKLSVGDVISCCDVMGKEFAKGKIISVKESTFENLTDEDKKAHEKFSSDEEMYQTYSKYYKMKVTPKTKLKIIKFSLLS